MIKLEEAISARADSALQQKFVHKLTGVQLKKLTKSGECPMCTTKISEHAAGFAVEIKDASEAIKDENNVLPGKPAPGHT